MPTAEYIKVILDNFLGQHFGAIDPRFHQYEFPSQAASFALDISFPGQRRSIQEQGCTNLAGEDGLKEVIAMAATCECEDPRDRAFGTLALIDWQGQQAIQPDYRRSRLQVAMEVMTRINDMSIPVSTADALSLANAFGVGVGEREKLFAETTS